MIPIAKIPGCVLFCLNRDKFNANKYNFLLDDETKLRLNRVICEHGLGSHIIKTYQDRHGTINYTLKVKFPIQNIKDYPEPKKFYNLCLVVFSYHFDGKKGLTAACLDKKPKSFMVEGQWDYQESFEAVNLEELKEY